jgi:hypothetical protein
MRLYNLPILLQIRFTAFSWIHALVKPALENPQFAAKRILHR